jgi:hypothetical protein
VHTRCRDGQLDELVHLGRGDLEVGRHARVAGGEQRTEVHEVAVVQRGGGAQDAVVLRHDVPGPAEDDRVELLLSLEQRRLVDVAQELDVERGCRRLAGLAALAVLGVDQRVRHRRVDQHDGDARRQRDGLERDAAAVEQQRGALDPARRRELVHQPAGDADADVLRALAQLRDVLGAHRLAQRSGVQHRQRDGDLERRRRGQPGPDGTEELSAPSSPRTGSPASSSCCTTAVT